MNESCDRENKFKGEEKMTDEDAIKSLERIETRQQTFNGKPVIRDTRIKISVVIYALANGYTHEEIIEDYPDLCEQDIVACLLYAAKQFD